MEAYVFWNIIRNPSHERGKKYAPSSIVGAGQLSPSRMPKNFAFALYFDAALENQVLKVWNVLARRQISSLLIEAETRPHICLCVTSRADLELSKLQHAIESFATQEQPIAVTFSAVGGFCIEEDVMFLAPIPTLELLTFHNRFHELLDEVGVESSEYYQPGNWFPYCKVAQQLPKSQAGDAFGLFGDLKLPLRGYICDIGMVELKPFREYFSISLEDRD